MKRDGWALACLALVALFADYGTAAEAESVSRAADAAVRGDRDMLQARPEAVEAWKDMRFGMFICWGPVSLTGLEIGWSHANRAGQPQGGNGPTPIEVYDNLHRRWKPDRFDARQWVKVAREAGAKYMIFLVKHHDGFCLYDTKLTDYKITGPASAWKHDVMRDMADACRAAGLKLIVYYSQPDWHHPDYKTANHARYIEYFHGQIRELLTNYGKIDGLWFDLGGSAKEWDAEKLFRMARSIQPWLVINNRIGLPGDFDTPENEVGHFIDKRPWETNATLNHQWSWKPNDTIRSLEECIRMLVVCACGDGNFALNTGPMPDGRIEPQQAERFREMGGWLRKYGVSVYGTRGGPWVAPDARVRKQDGYYGKFKIAEGAVGRQHPQGQHDLPSRPALADGHDPTAAACAEDSGPFRADRRPGRGDADAGRGHGFRAFGPARRHRHDREAGARRPGCGRPDDDR